MYKSLLFFLLFISINSFANITTGVQGHNEGEVVALTHDEEVMQLCDFNKSIVVTSQHVLCVYNGKAKLGMSAVISTPKISQ